MDLQNKLENIKLRALKQTDPDEVARIMDEADPWEYPPLMLYELMNHLRAALYANIAKMFMNEELNFSRADIEKVNKITDRISRFIDEKGAIVPELPEDVKNLFTWLASLEGKMDIYDAKTMPRIINRYIDYAGGMIAEIYKREFGCEWELCEDGDMKYILKKGDVEIADPSNAVFRQLVWKQINHIRENFAVFEKKLS